MARPVRAGGRRFACDLHGPHESRIAGRAGVTSVATALRGVRVLEFSVGVAGPLVGRHLAAAGAEVIRVESGAHLDSSRLYLSPRMPEAGYLDNTSPMLTELHAGKVHVGLNLAVAEGLQLALRLA